MNIRVVPVCGARLKVTLVEPNFTVVCAREPNHEGNHKTIFSVDVGSNGVEYSWKS